MNLIDDEKVRELVSQEMIFLAIITILVQLCYVIFFNTCILFQAEKNVELRKKKPGYQAYDEFDESGEV